MAGPVVVVVVLRAALFAALIDVSDTEWRKAMARSTEAYLCAALIDVSDTEWRANETPEETMARGSTH